MYAAVFILLGLNKCFAGDVVAFSKFVSPLAVEYMPLSMAQFLMVVGIIEILAGLIVLLYPRLGAYLIVLWMVLIMLNLASMNAYYDVIARNIVFTLGALALAWLTETLQE